LALLQLEFEFNQIFRRKSIPRDCIVGMGEKEKSFIEDCLRKNPNDRASASQLLRKSLFDTGKSTVSTESMNDLNAQNADQRQRINQLNKLIADLESNRLTRDEFEDSLRGMVLQLGSMMR